MFPVEYPQFTTVTCLEWKPVLENDNEKEVIISSMRFLVREERVIIFAFVIMINHFHLMWQMVGKLSMEEVQRDFLKYTGQQIIKNFRNEKSVMHDEIVVNAKDRKRQVWERNSLSVPLWSPQVFEQKLDYIHMNPVKAGLCQHPEDYKYSSARFYVKNERNWDFLTHIDD